MMSESLIVSLRISMKNDIFRMNIGNRMSDVISKFKLKNFIYTRKYKDGDRSISFEKMKEMNHRIDYSMIILIAKRSLEKIEMQFGQHRMKLLQVMKKKSKE